MNSYYNYNDYNTNKLFNITFHQYANIIYQNLIYEYYN